MDPIVINRPGCGGANAVNMNSLPLSSVSEATKYEADCGLCGKSFPFGYVPNPRGLAETVGVEAEGIPTNEPSRSGGVGSGQPSRSPSPNDQRSNSLNPNNAASRASANNRSNQMNPNNSSFRVSQGRRG